jgi:hypothetical protein
MPQKKRSRKNPIKNPFAEGGSFNNSLTTTQRAILFAVYNVQVKTQSIEEGFRVGTDFLPIEQHYLYSQFCKKITLTSEELVTERKKLTEDNDYFQEHSPEYIANAMYLRMLDGTLIPAIDFFVDYTTSPKSLPWSQVSMEEKLKKDDLPIRDIGSYNRSMLERVLAKVRELKSDMVLLVNTHFLCNGEVYTSKDLDMHSTYVLFHYNSISQDVEARYIDNALSASKREEFEKKTLYIDGNSRKVFSVEDTLPKWAKKAGVVTCSLANDINIRIFNMMTSLLQTESINLEHNHLMEMQPWYGIYCAVCVLFDLHLGIFDDDTRRQILAAFGTSPNLTMGRKPPCGEESRNVHKLLYDSYEIFCATDDAMKILLQEAIDFGDINEQRDIEDVVSVGICSICKQCDDPSHLLLCDIEACSVCTHVQCVDPEQYPSATQTYPCIDAANEPPWFCPTHKQVEQSGVNDSSV